MFPRGVALLVAAVTFAACDGFLLNEPANPAAVSVSFSLAGAATPLGDAFDKADNVRVVAAVEGASAVEQTVSLDPGRPVIVVRLEVPLPGEEAPAAVTAELRRGPDRLFDGSGTVLLRVGATHEVELPLVPVPARLLVPESVVVEALGQPVQLPGAVGFATDDPIPGIPLTWSTTETEIHLTPDGVLTAGRNGTFAAAVTGVSLQAVVQIHVAAPPTFVGFVSAPEESAFPGEPLPGSPAVRVLHGEIPMAGIEVAFSADRGGAVSQSTVLTDDEGVASLAVWTLGDHGENTLTASAGSIPPAALRMETRDPCTRFRSLALGESVEGELVPRRSCRAGLGRWVERWEIDIPPETVFGTLVTSESFGPHIFSHFPGAVHQIGGRGNPDGNQIRIQHVIPGGAYVLSPGTRVVELDEDVGGPYTMSTFTLAEAQVGCIGDTSVIFGSVARASLSEEDCQDDPAVFGDPPDTRRFFDGYVILLRPGETVGVTLTAEIPFHFTRWTGGAFVEGEFGAEAGEQRTLSVTANELAFHHFYVIAGEVETTGSYTMSFTGSAGIPGDARLELLEAGALEGPGPPSGRAGGGAGR